MKTEKNGTKEGTVTGASSTSNEVTPAATPSTSPATATGETVIVINNDNLRKLYSDNPLAKVFLDRCKKKQFINPVTEVRNADAKVITFQSVLLDAKIMPVQTEMIATAKALEELGCGKYVSGRRGRASRFEWVVDTFALGRAATGENVEVSYVKAEPVHTTSKTTEGQVKHTYVLRPDFRAALVLPVDLTRSEAKRIGEFVSTLPIEIPVQKAA